MNIFGVAFLPVVWTSVMRGSALGIRCIVLFPLTGSALFLCAPFVQRCPSNQKSPTGKLVSELLETFHSPPCGNQSGGRALCVLAKYHS